MPKTLKEIEKYTSEFPDETQIAVALVQDKSVNYYGVVKKNDTLLSIDNFDRVFEIGSISKVFTATLLANLVHEEVITLDESIQDKLDIKLKGNPVITYKQLANHTSGLPAIPLSIYWKVFFGLLRNPFKRYSKSDLWRYLQKNLKLESKPGEGYQYSNLGYGLLGCLISRHSRASYEDLLQNQIFTIFDMKCSTTKRDRVKDRLVPGLDKNGKITPNWDFLAIEGAGAILSNVEDLSSFMMAQFDSLNQELGLTQKTAYEMDETIELGENKFDMNVGLGWHILKNKTGDIWHWHNGGTKGYHSSMVLDIKSKKGIVILSNVSVYNPKMIKIENLLFKLIKSQHLKL